MSEKKEILVLSSPDFGVGKETIGYYTGYILDNFHLGEFIYYWNYYKQPCSLLLQKPNTEGLTAIKLVVDSDEAASFLL